MFFIYSQESTHQCIVILLFHSSKAPLKFKYEKMKRTLIRLKNKKYPNIPKTMIEIKDEFNRSQNAEFGRTRDGKDLLYIDTVIKKKYSFMVFASKKVTDLVEEHLNPEERNYLMDGTFKVVPAMFYQLFIISIEYANDVCMLDIIHLLNNQKYSKNYSSSDKIED